MTTAPGVFAELGRGLGWAGRKLGMLWAYFDESGEHDSESGRLVRLTMGGGISRFSDWEALSMRWAVVLDRFQVPMFHMADFEARQFPFCGWSELKRRCLLKDLLDLAVEHVTEFVGYVGQPEKGSAALADAYETTAAKAVREASLDAVEEPLTVVFARHKEFSAAKIGRYFDAWAESRLIFGGVGDPAALCPLQVADIVAYEISRYSRSERPDKERYPFVRLAEKMRPITFKLIGRRSSDPSPRQ